MALDVKLLGDILREKRKSLSITQKEMANELNISQGYIAELENGNIRNPSFDSLLKIISSLKLNCKLTLDNTTLMNIDINEETTFSAENMVGEAMGHYTATSLRVSERICSFREIPIFGKIHAGIPIEATEDIIDYIRMPEDDVKDGDYFYLQVEGDSMIGSRIYNGDRVLIRRQQTVENGEIAVVLVNSTDAVLKRVKKIQSQFILYSDNPDYEPMLVRKEGIEIIGKVVKVEFGPGKRVIFLPYK